MKYEFLLFDADDTLFNFQSSAEKCFNATCKEFGFSPEQSDYSLYKVINQTLWDEYSLGKMPKSRVITERFDIYAEKFGKTLDSKSFADSYENKLAHTCILFPETEDTLKKLKSLGAKSYIITNGITFVQNTRLDLSPLRPYLSGVFISDEIGYAKPSKEYFEFVSRSINGFDKNKALIVGDSLISDIRLGTENGVKTCRMNYFNEPAPETVSYDYEIKRLNEIFKILEV